MRFDSLAAWLDWQAGLNPRSIDLGLDRVRLVWERLGAPRLDAAVITIAGTNGKGSSVAFAEAILHAGGYRSGCYTSPHLQHYNERIRVDQVPVDDALLCAAFERVDRARARVPLTYFEFGTLAALCIFSDARLDAVVLEVGLGGRLDAVNLIDPDVALITSIGLDHQDWLGTDRESIGVEKAGIMRGGRPAVFSGSDMPDSIRVQAQRLGARLLVAGVDYRVERNAHGWDLLVGEASRHSLPQPGMRGRVQIENAAGVLVALECLAAQLPLDQNAVRNGLLAARLPGRFDVRPGRPTWVLDVAHNPAAAAVLGDMLGDFFCKGRSIAVCGMLADKDAAGVAAVLAGRFDAWYLVDLSKEPRGMSAVQLAERIRPALGGTPVNIGSGVAQTMAEVAVNAGVDDRVVVFGSFLTVGAAMTWLAGDGSAAAKA
jgi:dihydrofolate synthase/folylpolyglutamate synthase